MRITLELDPQDVARFEAALASARRVAEGIDECVAIDAVREALARLPLARAPAYVRRQFDGVRRLIAMLEDDDWALPRPLRIDVLATLVYIADPEDLIPDDTAVIGYLDDAILIEVLLARAGPLLTAHAEFVAARTRLIAASDAACEAARMERARALARTRGELLARVG